MQIAILDYVGKRVIIRDIPKDMEKGSSEETACFFETQMGIRLNDCEYMIGDLVLDLRPREHICAKCGSTMTDAGDVYVCDSDSCGYNQDK